MNELTKYKDYYAIKYKTNMGIATILLTEHDLTRCRERAAKQDLGYERIPFLRRCYYAILLVIYG